MPFRPLSEISKFSQFLSGLFWPISIRKADMGPDLANFYLDAGYGMIKKISGYFSIKWHPRSSFLCSRDHRAAVLRCYSNIRTICMWYNNSTLSYSSVFCWHFLLSIITLNTNLINWLNLWEYIWPKEMNDN